jgi:hypothetical protein
MGANKREDGGSLDRIGIVAAGKVWSSPEWLEAKEW